MDMIRHKAPVISSGFTLLELMVVIAIAGILAAIAAPSFQELIHRNSVAAQAGQLAKGLRFARSEAIKRSAPVRVVAVDPADWGRGWRVVADTDRDNSFAAEEPLFQGESAPPRLAVATAATHQLANGYLAFTALGALDPVSDSFAVLISAADCRSDVAIQVSVNTAGAVATHHTSCLG
jgi:type II secretion system protein H